MSLEHLEERQLLSAGGLDPSFGHGGIVTTPVADTVSMVAMAIQPDGRTIVAGTAGSGDHAAFALVRYNLDGQLDATFGGDGVVTTAIGGQQGMVKGMAVQSDGKIVVIGWRDTPWQVPHRGLVGWDFVVARYNTDGSLDATFGDGGIVITDIAGHDDYAQSVVIQGDGKILVAGATSYYTEYSSVGQQVLVRYCTDGSLDNTFGSDGIAVIGVPSNVGVTGSMTLQGDGKIVLAGQWGQTLQGDGEAVVAVMEYRFAMVRCNPDGSLDTSFGDAGSVITGVASWNKQLHSVAIQGDGKLLAVGNDENDIVLIRYNSDGSLDTAFGGDGIVTTSAGYFSYGSSVALQGDGKILVAGQADTRGSHPTATLPSCGTTRTAAWTAPSTATASVTTDIDSSVMHAWDAGSMRRGAGRRPDRRGRRFGQPFPQHNRRDAIPGRRTRPRRHCPPSPGRKSYHQGGEGKAIRVASVGSGVLANDSDPDSPRLTAALVSGPSHGRLTLKSNGTFSVHSGHGVSSAPTALSPHRQRRPRATSAPCTVSIEIAGNSSQGAVRGGQRRGWPAGAWLRRCG